jgi:hypothetical protein
MHYGGAPRERGGIAPASIVELSEPLALESMATIHAVRLSIGP